MYIAKNPSSFFRSCAGVCAAFLFDEWRHPPGSVAAIRGAQYDLETTLTGAIEEHMDVESLIGQGHLRIQDDDGVRPLRVRTKLLTRVESHRAASVAAAEDILESDDGEWEHTRTVHRVHIEYADDEWTTSDPDEVIDLRLMDYCKRSEAKDDGGKCIEFYSFNNRVSRLHLLGSKNGENDEALDEWQALGCAVIHNLRTAYLSEKQQQKLLAEGATGILSESDQKLKMNADQISKIRMATGAPVLPPPVFEKIDIPSDAMVRKTSPATGGEGEAEDDVGLAKIEQMIKIMDRDEPVFEEIEMGDDEYSNLSKIEFKDNLNQVEDTYYG